MLVYNLAQKNACLCKTEKIKERFNYIRTKEQIQGIYSLTNRTPYCIATTTKTKNYN